jgi:hypothetical protein
MMKELAMSNAAFATGAAGIGVVNPAENPGGYVGPNIAIWVKNVFLRPFRPSVFDRFSLAAWSDIDLFFVPSTLRGRVALPDARGKEFASEWR